MLRVGGAEGDVSMSSSPGPGAGSQVLKLRFSSLGEQEDLPNVPRL
jgi:hypothetical protein